MSNYMGGKALKEARLAAGLTMRDVEIKTQEIFGEMVRQPTITRYEKGQINKPEIGVLAPLCIVYKVPLDDVIEAYGYPTRKVVPEVDPRLRAVERLAAAMPAEAREYYFEQLEHAANMALIKIWSMFPAARPQQAPEEYLGTAEQYHTRNKQKRDSDRPLTAAV